MIWLIFIPIILIVLWSYLKTNVTSSRKTNWRKPLIKLRDRYAKGEITTEEYLKKKNILENNTTISNPE